MSKRFIIPVLLFSMFNHASFAEQKIISFIHLNDLHAHLTPHYTLNSSNNLTKRGGLARMATVIKTIRRENPNNVLMNIGDTYHGGVEALYSEGNAIIEPVNALNIDVGVPGNWDYAYGPIVTRLRYAQKGLFANIHGRILRPNYTNLGANVSYAKPFWLKGKSFLQPTLLKVIDGINIGFIGLTSDIVAQMHDKLALGLSFSQGEAEYIALLTRHAKQLRQQGAKIVVVMSELSLQKDYKLANQLAPGLVDVFFSAHTHEATFEALQSQSGALVVEAGDDTFIGRMDVTFENGQVDQFNWRLIPVTHDIEPDADMLKLVKHARAPFLSDSVDLKTSRLQGEHKLSAPINTVVGHTQLPLHRKHSLESPFNNALTDMIRQYSATDIVMSKGFRFGSLIPAGKYELEDSNVTLGDITIEDVYRFFPAIYQYATAEIQGRDLKLMIEQGLTQVYSSDIFKQNGGWFEGFSGLTLEVDLSARDGQRITKLSQSDTGKTINDEQQLTVTGCVRPLDKETLCAFRGFRNVQPLLNPDSGEAWNNIDLFLHLLQKNEISAIERKNIIDIHQTLFWPETPFVQPLSGVQTSLSQTLNRNKR